MAIRNLRVLMNPALSQSKRSLVTLLAFVVVILSAQQPALAKSTTDPNYGAWTGEDSKVKPRTWKERTTKCEPCRDLVNQYNATMRQLFKVRAAMQSEKAAQQARLAEVREASGNAGLNSPLTVSLYNELEGINTTYSNFLELAKKEQLMLEQQANHLQSAIAACESQQCNTKKNKDKKIKVGGSDPIGNYAPNIDDLFK